MPPYPTLSRRTRAVGEDESPPLLPAARPHRLRVRAKSPAPGTSGKTLTVGAGANFPDHLGSNHSCSAGDTVDISAGVYKEAPPAWTVPLKIVFEQGASWI